MIQPPPVFQYVWGILWGAMALNLALGHYRMARLVAHKTVTEDERQSFTRGALLWTTAYCGVEAALQVASHARTPFCFLAFPPSSAYGWAALGVGWVAAAALLKWVWQGNGADLLGRIAPAFSRYYRARRYSPRQVQVWLTLLVVAALVGNIVIDLSHQVPNIC